MGFDGCSMESIEMLPASERWHPHMYALEVAVDTGLLVLIGYACFFYFWGGGCRWSA